MSDRASDPVGVPPQSAYDPEYPTATGTTATPAYPVTEPRHAAGEEQSKPRQVAEQARESAGQAAADVKDTAKEQAQRVGAEARTQARTVASEVRGKLSDQARGQNQRLVGGIRQAADQLDEMRGDRQDSPAAAVVSRVAEGGRQFADYLDRHGPDGVLREVEDFARRRPGAFLATALAAGFVVGRLGKSIAKADENAGKPNTDTFSSGYDTRSGYDTQRTQETYLGDPAAERVAGYEAGYVTPATTAAPGTSTTVTTEYAATGTGTPAVVEETYRPGEAERRS
ncbi:hypothetical protein AB0F81_44935 [Actinoplanes sp. NPDC024001]|uniref:hypothetical protein n=1 Tax=Actinoplanes sp. NPDC024001 TaxID=3154598 RepID=UPI0033DE35D5